MVIIDADNWRVAGDNLLTRENGEEAKVHLHYSKDAKGSYFDPPTFSSIAYFAQLIKRDATPQNVMTVSGGKSPYIIDTVIYHNTLYSGQMYNNVIAKKRRGVNASNNKLAMSFPARLSFSFLSVVSLASCCPVSPMRGFTNACIAG